MHDHLFQLDLDGQVTCSNCHCMDDEQDISGSYNGRRAVSETDNVGPIPTPEADLNQSGYGYDELKDFDMGLKDNNKNKITPFLGPNR